MRVATFNVLDGLNDGNGDPQAEYEATKAVLARIDADIVAFQELETATRAQWEQMAVELGYPYKVMVEENGSRAGFLYLGYYSRFPITQTFSVNSLSPASEMSRLPLRAVFDVPGAAKPLVIWNMHHKAASTDADQFRRVVEAYRIVQDINSYVAANRNHNEFLLLGDLNEDISRASSQRAQFVFADYQSFRGSFPASYVLGADLEALLTQSSLPYRAFPDDRYAGAGGGMHRLNLYQQNGVSRITRPSGGSILDYIFVSTALRDSPLGSPRGEVYNSQWDALYPGLPKAGQPLASGTSAEASDHLAVFADIEMEDAVPAAIAVSPAGEIEFSGPSGGPFEPALASYTITNPTSQPVEVTVGADVPWLVPDFPDGVAAGEGQIGLNVSIDAASAPSRPGEYLGRVRITETATGAAVVRLVRLRVNSSGLDFLTQQFFGNTPFNLANKSVAFSPDGSPGFYRATIRAATALPVDPAGGTVLALGDDAFAAVDALSGRVFQIFGRSESRLFVGSNGYVTFVSGDTDFSPTLEDHFRLPRISAAFMDLDPGAGGTVSYRWLPDRVAVTWAGVPRYGATTPNTFQVELFDDGRIRVTWLAMDNATPIVGISPGNGLSPTFESSVFGAAPATDHLPPAFEDFVRSYALDPLGNGALSFDADGDGYSNWMEFAFGGSPAAPQGSLMSVSGGEGGITFEFFRRLSGFSYVVESASSLRAGFDSATGINPARAARQTGVPEGWERATFTVSVHGAGFYRISASPN